MKTENIIAELIKAERIVDKHNILISSFCNDTDLHTFVDSCKSTYPDFDTDGETSCLLMYFGQYLIDVLFGPTTKTKDFLTLIFNYDLAARISYPIDMVFHVCGYDLVKQDNLMTNLKKEFFGNANMPEEFAKHILADNMLRELDGFIYDDNIHQLAIDGTLKLETYWDNSKQLFDVRTGVFYSKDYLPLMPQKQYEDFKSLSKIIHKL